MRNKKFLSIAMLLLLSVILVACGGNDKDEGSKDDASDNGEKPEFLSLLTGGTSGTYYPLGGGIAKVITDEVGISTDPLSSNASADNIYALHDDEAELAFTQTDVASYAEEGINTFDEPITDVLALGSLYPETVQIVTVADSGVTSIEDLKGKKVAVGAPGSGTYINAEQILEVHDMTMDDLDAQNLDFGESASGIKDGNIDAAFITAGSPTGAVEELQASSEVLILEVTEEKADELIEKYPYYTTDVVEEGTYGLKEDVTTVAVLAMLVVKEDISEDVVYDITKAIYENAESIAHGKADLIKAETALDGIGIEIHPGAQKYYDEVGVEQE